MKSLLTVSVMWLATACAASSPSEHDPTSSNSSSSGGGASSSTSTSSTGGSAAHAGGFELETQWVKSAAELGLDSAAEITQLALAPDGSVYLTVRDADDAWLLHRVEPNGTASAGAWPYPFALTDPSNVLEQIAHPGVTALPDGSVALTADGDFGGWSTRRLTKSGMLDWTNEFISGPGAYPAGAVTDDQDRILVFGIPGSYVGGDCMVKRYDAAGVEDEAFQVVLGMQTDPPLAQCYAAGFDRAASELVLSGMFALAGTNEYPLRGAVRRVTAAGDVESAPSYDDLFGPFETDRRIRDVVVMPDGTVVAAMSTLLTGGSETTSRRVALHADNSRVEDEWIAGEARLAVVADAELVAWVVRRIDGPLTLVLSRVGAAGFEDVAEIELDDADNHRLFYVVGAHQNDLWIAWWRYQGSSYETRLGRFTVKATGE